MGFLLTFSGAVSRTYKEAVRAASNVDINLASAPAIIGGATLNLKDRVLLFSQSIPAQNGIYVFQGVGSPLVRAVDANTNSEIVPGMLVPVAEGDYADKLFELATDAPITLGVTALVFQLALLPIDLTTDVTGVLPIANGGTNKSSWTEGRVIFAGASGNALNEDSELNWNNSTKRLGVGTASPNAKLQINNSGTQLGLSVYSTSSNNTAELYNQGTTSYTLALNSAANSAFTGASIGGYFARGTLSSRTQTLANDTLLSLSASGYTGTAVSGISAGISFAADQNTSAMAYGGQIVFATTPNSTVQPLPSARVVIKNDGFVGIGTLLPTELLDVNGTALAKLLRADDDNNSTDIIYSAPLLVLNNQNTTASTSSFIEFRGTAGFSNSAKARIGSVFTGVLDGELSFQVQDTGAMIEKMRLKSDGKLSIASLTASRVMISDASKNLSSSSVTDVELGYLSGVTSSVQTQLGNKEQKGYYTRVATGISYAMSATDDYVGCTANSITVTLPLASVGNGKRVIIKDESGTATTGTISIARSGSDLIDGQTSESLTTNYESITLVSDGVSKWFII